MFKKIFLISTLILSLGLTACMSKDKKQEETIATQESSVTEESSLTDSSNTSQTNIDIHGNLVKIPDYSGEKYIEVNSNIPFFTDEEKAIKETFISLSDLDDLRRCGTAFGLLGQETRTYEERGDISKVYPSGWNQLKLSDGSWAYNRCHLIMYALSGLNDDERNLITGTRDFNAGSYGSMLTFENEVLYMVDNFNAHVLYRVTPVYDGDNLVAKGVLMEAYAIEYPEECEFCVFVYNVQDGLDIDYTNGIIKENNKWQ